MILYLLTFIFYYNNTYKFILSFHLGYFYMYFHNYILFIVLDFDIY